jgi:hypothetical protein
MKKPNIFKWTGFGLLVVVLAGAAIFVFRTRISSSKIVLRDELKENRILLHNASGDHACDCFLPTISNFKVSNITATSANFTWDCDAPSTYQVNYGIFSNKGTKFPSITPDVPYKNHTVTLEGLKPKTVYHVGPSSICLTQCAVAANYYLRKEWQQSNGQRDWIFTTLDQYHFTIKGSILTSAGDGISKVTVTLSGDSSGTVTTTSAGEYQFDDLKTGNYTVTPSKTGYKFDPPFTTYASLGADQTGKNFSGTPGTAVLMPSASCVISECVVAKVTAKEVTITWKTNTPATSLVNYGLTMGYGMKSGVNTEMVKNHDIQLFDLKEGTTYHCRAVSYTDNTKASVETTAFSSDLTFTTPKLEARIASKENIFNEPNPCSQYTMFSYYCYQPMKSVTIDILTLSGKLVASLQSPSSALAANWNKVRWDVRDNGGKPLANGLYVYHIRFQTPTNNVMEVKSTSLRITR